MANEAAAFGATGAEHAENWNLTPVFPVASNLPERVFERCPAQGGPRLWWRYPYQAFREFMRAIEEQQGATIH